MDIAKKYEDVVAERDAALAREDALREELEVSPDVSIKNCIFEGENRDGSQAFEFEISEGRLNKLTKINLDGWLCYGPSGGNPIDALQQRLTVAEHDLDHKSMRASMLDGLLRELVESLPADHLQHELRLKILAALKPAEDYNELDDDEDLEVFDDQ